MRAVSGYIYTEGVSGFRLLLAEELRGRFMYFTATLDMHRNTRLLPLLVSVRVFLFSRTYSVYRIEQDPPHGLSDVGCHCCRAEGSYPSVTKVLTDT